MPDSKHNTKSGQKNINTGTSWHISNLLAMLMDLYKAYIRQH